MGVEEQQQLEFQTQTGQICSEDLTSGMLLFLPMINKYETKKHLASTLLFIHIFILNVQRLLYDVFNQAPVVWFCPLSLLNPHQVQLNSASFMRAWIIYEFAYTARLIEWQIPWLSDKTVLSHYLRRQVKSETLPSLFGKISQRISVLKYIVSFQLLINVLKDTIRPSHGQFFCVQAPAFGLATFIFSTFFEEASGWKAQTGSGLDWDFNCHVKSDKVLICPPGTERLDITLDECAVEQKWQEAGEDKMPSAKSFFYLLSQQDNSQLKHLNRCSLLLYCNPLLCYESWEHNLIGVHSDVNEAICNYFRLNVNFILLH